MKLLVRPSQASLTPQVRRAVLRSLWDKENDNLDRYDPYFVYYEAQCTSLAGIGRLWENGHEEMLKIMDYLKSGQQTRESLAVCLHQDPATIDDSITLAARLWLMPNIGELLHSYTPGQTIVGWDEGSTLKACVDRHFTPTHYLDDPVKLPKGFNAFQLERIAGIKVAWTNNLADHLLMRDDDTKVLIFPHATFLRCHKTSKQ